MANATSTQLQELYVAYFGRAADPTGLEYWTSMGTTTAAFAATGEYILASLIFLGNALPGYLTTKSLLEKNED